MKVKRRVKKLTEKATFRNEDHGIWCHHRWGNSGKSDRLLFWAPKSLQMVTAAMKLKDTYSLEGKL